MRYAVEAWATEYGTPVEDADALTTPQHPALLDIEVAVADWAPRRPPTSASLPRCVVFTDGVRRIDARVWITGDDGATSLGLCASYAAGVVRAGTGDHGGAVGDDAQTPRGAPVDGVVRVNGGAHTDGAALVGAGARRCAEIVACDVGRGLFTSAAGAEAVVTRHATFAVRAVDSDAPDRLSLALQQRMGELEVALAERSGPADLVVIDGPLRGRQHLANAIGYVKTHHVAYLPPTVEGVVAALEPGERTPLFVTTSSWSRYSWYVRLPGGHGHAWAGVVRCEASGDLDEAGAVALADMATATLPRFASRPHKDSRAPQNLYPIAGLERALRHRMGDPSLVYRSLRTAAAGVGRVES